MNIDDKSKIDGISELIDKEIHSHDKLYKPDFNQKTGRELLAYYLQSKFKQVLAFDRKAAVPIFTEIKPDFIQKFSRRLVTNPHKRILISITGESASGKSTICRRIQEVAIKLNMPVSIFTTDNYFNDISELIKKYETFDNLRDNGFDVDSPENFQLELLSSDLSKISEGFDIYSPEYLPNGTGISVPHSKLVKSNKVVVVEGMASMFIDNTDLFDAKIYVETVDEVRKGWFLARALNERNQDLENAKKHWNYIVDAGNKYIKPIRKDCDIVINGLSGLDYFTIILEYIYTITNNFQ